MQQRIVLIAAVLTVVACATPLADETRVHLGDNSFLELRLPVNWDFRPVFVGAAAEQLRLFADAQEVMTVMPIRWNNDATIPASDPAHLRSQARGAVRARGLCLNEEVQERPVPEGIAVYCSKSGPDGKVGTKGIVASPRLVAAFAFENIPSIPTATFWHVIETVKHFSFEKDAA